MSPTNEPHPPQYLITIETSIAPSDKVTLHLPSHNLLQTAGNETRVNPLAKHLFLDGRLSLEEVPGTADGHHGLQITVRTRSVEVLSQLHAVCVCVCTQQL